MTPTETKAIADQIRALQKTNPVGASRRLGGLCADFVCWVGTGPAVYSQPTNVSRIAETIVELFSDEVEVISTTPRDGFKTGRRG